MYHFFAMLSRMKYINRWGLMRNTRAENICEHSLDVGLIAHALALIGNKKFGKNYDAERAAVLGMLAAVLVQGASITEILQGIMNGFTASTGVEAVDALLNRGGLLSMMKTVALAIVALSFAGVFECTGMASSILKKVVSHVKTERGLVIATILTAWGILLGTGQQYVAIIMAGRLFRPLYQEYNLKPQNLSRALEDAGTVFGGIVPYSTGAGFTEGMLGVSAWQYGPFTFFGWINPLVAILIAALGKSMPHLGQKEKGRT